MYIKIKLIYYKNKLIYKSKSNQKKIGLLIPKKNLNWIKTEYVFFKEFNLARKIVFNYILDLVIIKYMRRKIDNFDGSAKNKI
jgi:hypothetical protein